MALQSNTNTKAPRKRLGMTLVEVAISSLLFAFLGFILTTSMNVGIRTQQTVSGSIASMDVLRDCSSKLRNGIRLAADSSIVSTTLSNGECDVTFEEPLTVNGSLTWGVYDTRLGADINSHTQPGWNVQYTVVSSSDPSNTTSGIRNDLVCRIRDANGATQFEETLISGLYQGGVSDPGFSVLKTGEMWEIKLQCAGDYNNTKGPSTTMQVRARN